LTRPVRVQILFTPIREKQAVAVTFDDCFDCVARNALPLLLKKNIPVSVFVPTGSIGKKPTWLQGSGHPDEQERIMNSAQIRSLYSAGIHFGSHTVTHRNWKMIDDHEVKIEVLESKKTLESIIGDEVTSISFPFGAFNKRQIEHVIKYHYRYLFTIVPHRTRIVQNAFIIGRTKVGPDDWMIEYMLKILGGYRWLEKLSRKQHFISQLSKAPFIN
jgi:peptidoglycan/xylan/chitin deacetylase (PgdA/CDA1 family)